MEYKLKSGRKVELKRPSLAERIECNDANEVSVNQAGEMTIKHNFRAMIKWACAGLGCDEKELDKFGDEEVTEIAGKVKELAALGEAQKKS